MREVIPIPKDVNVQIEGDCIKISGTKGELQRELWYPGITITKEDSEIIVKTENPRKKESAMMGTFASHIRNMIIGVTEGFVRTLKIVYTHFPIQVKVEGNAALISNFLGERKPRRAEIVRNSKVQIDRDEIIVTGIDKEGVCQTAANIEQATKIRRYDPRVFQDGIYVIG
ncbi:MAG: 50S ribosomal protein L6 [Methanocellales archaeon]|nr:50S ribosomal protein L6 [Methanocellales archaeon]